MVERLDKIKGNWKTLRVVGGARLQSRPLPRHIVAQTPVSTENVFHIGPVKLIVNDIKKLFRPDKEKRNSPLKFPG